MSNASEKGWEWLEAKLHHAIEVTLQSTPPDGVKVAVKNAVSKVLAEAQLPTEAPAEGGAAATDDSQGELDLEKE